MELPILVMRISVNKSKYSSKFKLETCSSVKLVIWASILFKFNKRLGTSIGSEYKHFNIILYCFNFNSL